MARFRSSSVIIVLSAKLESASLIDFSIKIFDAPEGIPTALASIFNSLVNFLVSSVLI